MRKYLTLLLALSIIAGSCNNSKKDSSADPKEDKDEKEETTKKKDKKEEVDLDESDIAGVYTITDIRTKPEDGKEQDLYDRLDECQKKNTYGFNKGGVWYIGGVATQTCTGPDESGTWQLNGDKLVINSEQSGRYEYTIVNFDGKNLEVSSETEQNGTHATLTTTFTKQ